MLEKREVPLASSWDFPCWFEEDRSGGAAPGSESRVPLLPSYAAGERHPRNFETPRPIKSQSLGLDPGDGAFQSSVQPRLRNPGLSASDTSHVDTQGLGKPVGLQGQADQEFGAPRVGQGVSQRAGCGSFKELAEQESGRAIQHS